MTTENINPLTRIKEDLKGCGKEACAVMLKATEIDDRDIDIIECGVFCPYHKKIELCPTCKAKLQTRIECYKEELKFLEGEEIRDDHETYSGKSFFIEKRITSLKEAIALDSYLGENK